MITNSRIEKKKADIARTEKLLAEVRAKLRNHRHDLIRLENDEIIAMFRSEIITEDDFAALMRLRREAEAAINAEDDMQNFDMAYERKEDTDDAVEN